MALYRIQCTMKLASGLPDDVIVNTFFVQNSDHVPGDFETVLAWKTFLESIWDPVSDAISQTGHTLKCYDMADDEPRVPKWTYEWGFTDAPDGDPLPTEVALCVSYEGAHVSGLDQRNRRGRMYLGPLSVGTNVDGRPYSGIPAAWLDEFEDLLDDLAADDSFFVVYSPTTVTTCFPVTAWIDNAFDTQRRRGYSATSRSTKTLPTPP